LQPFSPSFETYAFSARVWVEAETMRSRAKWLRKASTSEAASVPGWHLSWNIDEPADQVLVAVLGAGPVVAATANNGY
jgi:hypothetical protein